MNAIDSTPLATALAYAAVTPPSSIGLRRFLFAMVPSFLLGRLFTIMFPGAQNYLIGFGFLFAVACTLAVLGWKTQRRRRVGQAVVLMWLAPLLPLIVTPLVHEAAYEFFPKGGLHGH
jgi:hypothetical protein